MDILWTMSYNRFIYLQYIVGYYAINQLFNKITKYGIAGFYFFEGKEYDGSKSFSSLKRKVRESAMIEGGLINF